MSNHALLAAAFSSAYFCASDFGAGGGIIAGERIKAHRRLAIVAPVSGPTHQIQWLSQLSATRDGPKLRVGLIEQPVKGMRFTCAMNTAKPMGIGARLSC